MNWFKRNALFAATALTIGTTAKAYHDITPASDSLRKVVETYAHAPQGTTIVAYNDMDVACGSMFRISAIMPDSTENILYRAGLAGDENGDKKITFDELEIIRGGLNKDGTVDVIIRGPDKKYRMFTADQNNFSITPPADAVVYETLEEAIKSSKPKEALRNGYDEDVTPVDPNMLMTDFVAQHVDITGYTCRQTVVNFPKGVQNVMLNYVRRDEKGEIVSKMTFNGKNNGQGQLTVGNCTTMKGNGGQISDQHGSRNVFGIRLLTNTTGTFATADRIKALLYATGLRNQ